MKKKLCVKNYQELKQNCLNGKNLRCGALNGKYSEWENQDIDGCVITLKETDPYSPNRIH